MTNGTKKKKHWDKVKIGKRDKKYMGQNGQLCQKRRERGRGEGRGTGLGPKSETRGGRRVGSPCGAEGWRQKGRGRRERARLRPIRLRPTGFFRVRPIRFWSKKILWTLQFRVWGLWGWGPCRWGPCRWGPCGWGPCGWGPEGWVMPQRVGGPKISRFFFPLQPQFSLIVPSFSGCLLVSFFLSLGCLLVEF